MPTQLKTSQPPALRKKTAIFSSEGDEVAGDPPSPRLGVLAFLLA
jgi:hypothetical protein